MVYLPAVFSRPGPNKDPDDSRSNDECSDHSRRGRRDELLMLTTRSAAEKKKFSCSKRRDCPDSDTEHLGFTNSGEDSNHSHSDASDDLQSPQHHSGRRSLRQLRRLNALLKNAVEYRSFRLLKKFTRYVSKVAKYIGCYHKNMDIQFKGRAFSGADGIAVLSFL